MNKDKLSPKINKHLFPLFQANTILKYKDKLVEIAQKKIEIIENDLPCSHADDIPSYHLGQTHKQAIFVPQKCNIQPMKQDVCDGYD